MFKLLFNLLLFQIVYCSCPPGFELVCDGECRGLYKTMSLEVSTVVQTIIAECNEIEGEPVIIHNDEDNSYWTQFAKDGDVMIGLVCNAASKAWEWADGTQLDFKPPSYSPYLNDDCKTGIFAWHIRSDGTWDFYNSGTANFRVFCTTQLKQPVPTSNSCQHFEDDSEDGVCYQIGDAAANWQDAQLNCRKLGANLASIHNAQENAFIRRLAVSKGAVNGVFLGATISGKGEHFGWIDGTDWDYENFHPGFPRDGFGDCLVMDTTTSAGDWMNVDCATKLPVACIRDPITIIAPNATCSLDTWKEGQIMTSPGFPFNAAVACEYWLTVDAGKKVELEIILLEANPCSDNLIIYDGYVGGSVMANLTGEVRNTTYTTTTSNIMRVNWEPNGVVNVLGLVMTFRGV